MQDTGSMMPDETLKDRTCAKGFRLGPLPALIVHLESLHLESLDPASGSSSP
jgi:hypothetical protein